jgi:hypothetical protein
MLFEINLTNSKKDSVSSRNQQLNYKIKLLIIFFSVTEIPDAMTRVIHDVGTAMRQVATSWGRNLIQVIKSSFTLAQEYSSIWQLPF